MLECTSTAVDVPQETRLGSTLPGLLPCPKVPPLATQLPPPPLVPRSRSSSGNAARDVEDAPRKEVDGVYCVAANPLRPPLPPAAAQHTGGTGSRGQAGRPLRDPRYVPASSCAAA